MLQFTICYSSQSAFMDASEAVMDTEEENAHCPPPSLVPRLHVIVANKMEHNNPLLPANPNGQKEKEGLDNILINLYR